jgi:chromosome segregation ATPase
MAFMRRDVNLGLLILIITSIIVFSGFTVYYQTSFKDVSLEYKSKLEQLRKVTEELSAKRQELNETYSLRVKAEEDRKALDQRYRDVSDENERLKNDNSNLRSELSSTKSSLAEKKAELDATQILLSQTQANLAAANSEISSLRSKRDRLQRDLDEVCDAYTALNGGVEHPEC